MAVLIDNINLPVLSLHGCSSCAYPHSEVSPSDAAQHPELCQRRGVVCSGGKHSSAFVPWDILSEPAALGLHFLVHTKQDSSVVNAIYLLLLV